MNRRVIIFLSIALIFGSPSLYGQRTYKSNSVLSAGSWYKIGIKETGVYKIDVPFLVALGINTSNINSSSLRIFGNGGTMLSEANADIRSDDLDELAIMISDGGDGQFNGTDYLIFYGQGSNAWLKDSINRRFSHQKNIYSDSSYYFLTIGGFGKRISTSTNTLLPSITVSSFNERYFYELDSVNLLSSGKEWLGEEFANAPGKTLSRNFSIPISGLQVSSPLTFIANCVSRSINTNSRFDVRITNQVVSQLNIPATTAGIYDVFAHQVQQTTIVPVFQIPLSIDFTYTPGSFNAQGWLNWFEIHARKNLILNSTEQLLFRDWNSVGNNAAEFIISNATSNLQVWEVTNASNPLKMQGNLLNNEFRFTIDCNRLKEYVAFNSNNIFKPIPLGSISNQDLHASQPADYLIITHKDFLTQAERIASFHRQKNNLRVVVTSTEKVFNEFASGNPDPTAVRDFVKMFYDKSVANPANRPKYLLLFGDASFDYKNRVISNTNLVPAYESVNSFDPLNTYTSDDFFGFLDDNENINSGSITNLLDIGIGRVPAKNSNEAKNFVDKLLAYTSTESLGSWRNTISMIADDEDNNLHIQDAELISGTIHSVNPTFNIQKIYLDAFQQESGLAGSRYPLVNETIKNRMFAGTLIFDFIGHGGASRLAEEVILDQGIINTWNNSSRLPLFITATCDFAPFDNPLMQSIGENLLLRPKTGAIALMTTTRLVFSFSNRIMNDNYLKFALQIDSSGRYKTLGEAVRVTKNYTYQTSNDIINNRKFTLLGDPALQLAFPKYKVSTTKINDVATATLVDTISAGEKVSIEGTVLDNSGSILSSFNGTVYPIVFDQPSTINTLGNDMSSQVTSFQTQSNVLFKGKASVNSGKFKFEFKVPRDLNYQFGNGKISYYTENGVEDGGYYFKNFIIGGSSTIGETDREGPIIKAWLNDEKFVNGSIANQSSVLIIKLFDTSGINTSGSGIGHDISITIDNDPTKYFVLNDFYEADLDDFKKGMLRFQLPIFQPGLHSIKIKAWDVFNNSKEFVLEFSVINDEELVINRVLNYPNPFTTSTKFWFEHNRPTQDLFVQIHIYSLTGRIIKKINKTINTSGNRSCELEWDGRDDFGNKLGRGVYIYRVHVRTAQGHAKSIVEKMVIL